MTNRERVGAGISGQLRAAVIGVGYLGRFHAQKYAALEGVRLVGVVDTNSEQARKVAEELGVPHHQDYRDLLGQVDLVSVAVPTVAHYGVASACLNAGVHVLLEKPITTTLEEADELIGIAEQAGLVLQVGHLKRFHPAVVALNRSGLLHSPRFIVSERYAPFKPRALDVDVALDLMIHDVDLILNFVGSDVVRVEAVGAPVVTDKVDIAHAQLKFANGCLANVSASRIANAASRNIRLFQRDSYFNLDFIKKEIRVKRRGEGSTVMEGEVVHDLENTVLPIQDYDTLEMEIRAFCEAVREGHPPLVSGRDGRKALEVVLAIRQEIGKFIKDLGHDPRTMGLGWG